MLDRLTVAMFEEQLGKPFRLSREGAPDLELLLIEARGLSSAAAKPGAPREPFSLVFQGPERPVLPQRIYALDNEAMGRLEIFLVPIESGADGTKYEAIFN